MSKLYLVFIVLLISVFVVGCNPASMSTLATAKSETNKIMKEDFKKGVVTVGEKAFKFAPPPSKILSVFEANGLVNYIKNIT